VASLTFEELRKANSKRVGLFKNKQGGLAHPTGGVFHWLLSQWTNALCGEAGESANFAKKIERGDFPDTEEGRAAARDAIGKELADTVCYCDLAAQRAGIDLGQYVTNKFNEVSTKQNLPVFLIPGSGEPAEQLPD